MNLSTKLHGNKTPLDGLLNQQENFTGLCGDVKVSDEPPVINVDTPAGSESNTFPWPPEKLQILVDHLAYSSELELFCNSVLDNGPFDCMPILKKPKSKLTDLFGPKRNKKLPLTGKELHEYLVKKLVNQNDINVRQLNLESLETMIPTLQNGYHILKQHNSNVLRHYLKFGELLNIAFAFFKTEKFRNHLPVDATWNSWLATHVGISASNDRDLRKLAKDFGCYKRLQYLGISRNEFKSHEEKITLMFVEFPDLAKFWKEDIAP